ncbi:hypothetical protein BS50DRAFT_295571 [Corynespora cassiicola Philippines]|uniref:Uncharacterized protein n=1 Tax=Corynespora cassiicola Philippines TaxID=1448308 RepID=A0A2T2NWG4_CORCC|nr:hypothetical protein BS50DRAFT_295571 [Corynespora cassiicola Philippines]
MKSRGPRFHKHTRNLSVSKKKPPRESNIAYSPESHTTTTRVLDKAKHPNYTNTPDSSTIHLPIRIPHTNPTPAATTPSPPPRRSTQPCIDVASRCTPAPHAAAPPSLPPSPRHQEPPSALGRIEPRKGHATTPHVFAWMRLIVWFRTLGRRRPQVAIRFNLIPCMAAAARQGRETVRRWVDIWRVLVTHRYVRWAVNVACMNE